MIPPQKGVVERKKSFLASKLSYPLNHMCVGEKRMRVEGVISVSEAFWKGSQSAFASLPFQMGKKCLKSMYRAGSAGDLAIELAEEGQAK